MIRAIPIIAENRIREAMERGEFERLEGAGRPLADVDGHYDPQWWLKRKLQREQLTAEETAAIVEWLKGGRAGARPSECLAARKRGPPSTTR